MPHGLVGPRGSRPKGLWRVGMPHPVVLRRQGCSMFGGDPIGPSVSIPGLSHSPGSEMVFLVMVVVLLGVAPRMEWLSRRRWRWDNWYWWRVSFEVYCPSGRRRYQCNMQGEPRIYLRHCIRPKTSMVCHSLRHKGVLYTSHDRLESKVEVGGRPGVVAVHFPFVGGLLIGG